MPRIKARDIHEEAMQDDPEYRAEYEALENEYKAEDEALAESDEALFLQDVLRFIQSDKNVPPKDIAAALRCDRVLIPKGILHYAAGLLDGSPKRRGKPIDVKHESAKEAFSDRNFLAEDVQARHDALKKEGMKKYDILETIAEGYGKSADWVSAILYPRHKE